MALEQAKNTNITVLHITCKCKITLFWVHRAKADMSYNNNRRSNNLTGSWRTGQRTGHDHDYETSRRTLPIFPNSPPTTHLWGPLGYSLSGFPTQSLHSPMRVLVLNTPMAREANPGQRPVIRGSPPGYFGQSTFSIPAYEEETMSRPSSQGGQNSALRMLKREIYNSPPNSITKRLSSFYRERDQGKSLGERTIEQDDDENGKRCAVCLDDFEPKQEVMVTPCKHMFHEDCIVPWMKSNDQCPVCRFTMSEPGRPRQRAMPMNNNNISQDMVANGLFSGELISVIRVMEEAFQWGSVVP